MARKGERRGSWGVVWHLAFLYLVFFLRRPWRSPWGMPPQAATLGRLAQVGCRGSSWRCHRPSAGGAACVGASGEQGAGFVQRAVGVDLHQHPSCDHLVVCAAGGARAGVWRAADRVRDRLGRDLRRDLAGSAGYDFERDRWPGTHDGARGAARRLRGGQRIRGLRDRRQLAEHDRRGPQRQRPRDSEQRA